MTDTPDRASLAAQIASASLLRGTFTLRSGRTSSYYLDKYRFSTLPGVLGPVGRLLGERALEHLPARLAGAELGGIPLVTAASLHTALPCLFVRNAKKDYGTAKQLEGHLEAGDRVVFVEDVATTGGQALEGVAVLRAAGADVRAVIAVIDRQEGAREAIERAGIAFGALFTKADLGIAE